MSAAADAVERQDDETAEGLFRSIVALNPSDAQAWHMLALIAVRGGRAAEGVECASQAHRLDRRNHLYLNTLGVAHAETGKLDEAIRWLRRAVKENPADGETHYNLGKACAKLGQLSEAERCFLRARRLEPEKARAANNLGVLYSQQGRYGEALPLFEEARAGMPDDASVAINCALAKLATAGPGAALDELYSFVQAYPDAAAAHAELGRRLLAEGRMVGGWAEYAWREAGSRPPLPAHVSGKRVILLPEQGLGDHLFFLRFARHLRGVAVQVAFACPAKLQSVLEGSDAVDRLCPPETARAEFDVQLSVGDLPRLVNTTGFPAPIALHPRRMSQWRERLERLGPAPYLGVTWRAGSKLQHDMEFVARGEDPLFKEIGIDALASAVRAWRGSVLILQRAPAPSEVDAFARALGGQAHDLSALNDDLADMLAVLALIDEYVGVSNTNMHLRAGTGRAARVLVPFPPEFRWMHSGERSPWFPSFPLYRQSPTRDWGAALRCLQEDLTHIFQ